MKSSPHSPQWEKACSQKQRPSLAKNKINKIFKKEWAVNLEPFLTKSRRASQPYSPWWAYDLTWEYLPLFQMQLGSALFCLRVWVIWHVVSPTAISVPAGWEHSPSTSAQEGWMQVNCPSLTTGRNLLDLGVWHSPLQLCLPLPLLWVKCCSTQGLIETLLTRHHREKCNR